MEFIAAGLIGIIGSELVYLDKKRGAVPNLFGFCKRPSKFVSIYI